MRCCVPSCTNKTRKYIDHPVYFHRFPSDEETCKLWLVLTNHRLAKEPFSRSAARNIRVCSDHFSPEDYRKDCKKNILKSTAVPRKGLGVQTEFEATFSDDNETTTPFTQHEPTDLSHQLTLLISPEKPTANTYRRSMSGTYYARPVIFSRYKDQDISLKEESSPTGIIPQPDHKFPRAKQQHSPPSYTVLAQRARIKGRRKKVLSKTKNTLTSHSSFSGLEEKSWRKAVRSLQMYQGANIFKSSEVLVNTQCLLELFQYCWLCQIECCITIEGHERQFSITQDCQSCGHHKLWRSHPVPTEEPVETFLQEEHFHKEEKASYPEVEYTLEEDDADSKEVVVQIVSSDNEGTEQNEDVFINNDGSYLLSDRESEQEEEKKDGKQYSSDEWEPHLDKVASDSDVSLNEENILKDDLQGKVVMWCTVCKSDATLSCSIHLHKKVFACVQCGAGDNIEKHSLERLLVHFEDFPSFQKHAEKEHEAKPIHHLCQECGNLLISGPNSSGSTDHICVHKTKHIVCPECGKRFFTEIGLKSHFSKLHKDANHPCKYCLKLFKNRPAKLEHEQTHPKEELPYHCPDCPERFDNIHKRNSHLRLHRGPYKHACDTCEKRFKDVVKLNRHKLIHSGEKPFTCSVCDRSFNQSENLSSHMRLHTGEKRYRCEQCGECFNYNVSLKKHLMRYHHSGLSQTETPSWQSDFEDNVLNRDGC